MIHHASKNWRNQRTAPLKGIRSGDPSANRNAVRVLISGSETESLDYVRRHAENAAWLKLADEIEFAKSSPRQAVLSLIRLLREKRVEGMEA